MSCSFSKVSYEQFEKDYIKCYGEIGKEYIKEAYDGIILPRRATRGSAGYDFFSPISFKIDSGDTILVPTGIRCHLDMGLFLEVVPRSGLGFKYRMQLDNTVGIIDADYYFADNEGHIMVKFTNDSKYKNPLTVPAGTAMAQGIIMSYYITVDDDVCDIRTGGFGSTDKK